MLKSINTKLHNQCWKRPIYFATHTTPQTPPIAPPTASVGVCHWPLRGRRSLAVLVCSLHMEARQYSILFPRHRKLKTRRYFINDSWFTICTHKQTAATNADNTWSKLGISDSTEGGTPGISPFPHPPEQIKKGSYRLAINCNRQDVREMLNEKQSSTYGLERYYVNWNMSSDTRIFQPAALFKVWAQFSSLLGSAILG